MQNTTSKILLRLVGSVINDSMPSAELINAAKENIEALLALAKHHDLGHLLLDVLTKGDSIDKNTEIYRKLEREKLSAIYRSLKMENELKMIKSTLSEAGIAHLPLKGAVIRALYPEPYMRTSCDIDMLVDRADLDRSVKLLCEKLGYTTDGEIHFHDTSLYSPSGFHLELHFSILENYDSLDKVLSRVMDYASPVSDGASLYQLSPEFLIFHLLAHTAYHFLSGGPGIKPFADLYLLEKKVDYDREVLLSLCREAGIDVFAAAAEKLCRVWFDGLEADDFSAEMEAYILKGGVYGTEVSRAASLQAKNGGKLGHILSMIFMPYKNLKILYPSLEKRPYLFPFYQVRRWFRIIFKGRLAKAVRTINTNARLDGESVKNTSELFRRLGL